MIVPFKNLLQFRDYIIRFGKGKEELQKIPLKEFMWGLSLCDKNTRKREAVVMNVSIKDGTLIAVKRDGKLVKITLERLFQAYVLADGRVCGRKWNPPQNRKSDKGFRKKEGKQ